MNLSTLNPNELVGPSGRNVQSAYFDGTGDYLLAPSAAALAIGTSAFTLEGWCYFNNTNTNGAGFGNCAVFTNDPSTARGVSLFLTGSGAWRFRVGRSVVGEFEDFLGTTVLVPGQWYYFSIIRTSIGLNDTRVYLNGVQEAIGTSTISLSMEKFAIGVYSPSDITGQALLNGYASGVRFSNVARPSSVPTTPVTSDGNTLFLLGFSEYRFTDQSPNNFTITRNGDTTQSTFGPYGNNWSNYFDGTGDYLSIGANAAFDFGTGNFTIEAWVYISGNSALDGNGNRPGVIFAVADSVYSASFIIDGNPSTTGTGLILYGPAYSSVAGTITQNTWHHLAVSKSGTSVYFWLDGTQLGTTQTTSGSWGSSTKQAQIGQSLPGLYTFPLNGYISNLRVLKGTALYTSTFTPPSSPLTAITNTSLLTCQSNRFLDSSPNNFAITRNGDVSVQPYGPFAGPVPEPVVDVYTTTGVANTWIKRPGAKAVQMIAIGAGGGGGGGGTGSAGTFRNGGSGGGGGANGQIIYTADQLPATLYIRVGASGTAGVSNGAGGAGGNSTIAAADPITTSTSVYCMGGGGGGGKQGGQATEGGGGGTAGAGATGTGASAVGGGLPSLGAVFAVAGGGGGGGYSNTSAPGPAEWGGGGGGCARQAGDFRFDGASSMYGGGGGGIGSALNTGGGVNGGTSGGGSGLYQLGGGGAGGVFNSNGAAGANASGLYAAGAGGGGGFANGSGTGYLGGAGGFPGGGGGGGGAGSSAGGTGGVGGAGRVVVVTFF